LQLSEQSKICLITPPRIDHPDQFFRQFEDALAGGIRFVQFRNKQFSKKEALGVSLKLRDLCRRYQSRYLINDDIDLTMASDADGVHIGQEDFPLALARKILGPKKIVGVSTHNVAQAVEAEKGGADYIGFGAVFQTSSKEKTEFAGLQRLIECRMAVSIPIIAIGGVSLSNIALVFKNGASGAAVISAVWDQDSPAAAVRDLQNKILPNG
jgi:thiamine-phosphate diphosphorylase